MAASKENPIYSVYIVSDGTRYNVTGALISIDFTDDQKQMAKSVNIQMLNVPMKGGTYLVSLLKVRSRVFIYANDGETHEEVFRGYLWTRSYISGATEREITLKCYDNLIYLQESEDHLYFAKGKDTKDVFSTICKNWGIPLNYTYDTITHSKLALRGSLADIMTSDILDLVKDRTGKKYTIRSEKDEMNVSAVGSNKTIYTFQAKANAMMTRNEITMSGMVTKVVIYGKADGNDRQPVEATIKGNTDTYGTLQGIINRSENTSLADAKKEANSILKEKGTPKCTYELRAVDVPWIRKGDKIYINAGGIYKSYLIVTSINRSIGKAKEMILELEDV